MDIVLFGIQGSGKGTIAKAVAQEFGFAYFETGAALRKLSNEKSQLAKKVQAILASGNLVPNDIVMEIVEDFIEQCQPMQTVIFDGIPRSMPQAKTFDALMKKRGRNFIPILVDVPKVEAKNRLLERKRYDDNEEAINKRFENYFEQTIPVIKMYREHNNFTTIDGTPDIETVRNNMFHVVKEQILNLS